jgi:hypothetical protein
MPDDSHLDYQYFIDVYKYNCPFCNRRHVSYRVDAKMEFDWTVSKKCYIYVVRCDSCENLSMHLSYEDIALAYLAGAKRFYMETTDLDNKFFFSVPSSFFVMDSNIPRILRELFTEAEGCLQGNFLTGASACLRKVVYELAKIEKAEGDSYDERIKSIKNIKPNVDPAYFDTLLAIQKATSDKVHENAYDKWEAKHLKLLLATTREILQEIYVTPKEKEKRRASVLDLFNEVLGNKKAKDRSSSDDQPKESHLDAPGE